MLLKHFQERQNSNFSMELLISSTIWPWLTFPAIGLTVLNSSSIHVPFFNLSWISQGFTWSQDFVHLPACAFCNLPPWPNWSPVSFVRAPWLTEHTLMDPFTEFILGQVTHLPLPTSLFWAIIKSKNNYGFILLQVTARACFPGF